MNQKFKLLNGTLKQLIIIFLVISLILIFLLTMISFFLFSSAMHSNTEQTIELYASEQQKLLNEVFQSIKTALYSLANKQAIRDYLNGNSGYKVANAEYITALLSDVPNYIPSISDVVLAMPNLHLLASSYVKSDIQNFLLRYKYVEQYYAQGQNGLACFTITPVLPGQYMLAVAIPVESASKTGIVMAYCTNDDLFKKLGFFDKPFAIYYQGNMIWSNSSDVPSAQEVQDYIQADSGGLYNNWIHLSLNMVQWDLLIKAPIEIPDGQVIRNLLRWTGITILIFIVIECSLSLAIYKTIILPISSISNQSAQINFSSHMIHNPAPGRYEIDSLVHNINDMVIRTNQLTNQINAAKLRLMEMDIIHLQESIMFLQAQINPHFLYNMLECICGMATVEGNMAIRETTHLLSRMYQYCLKSPESTLGEELESVVIFSKIIQQDYRQKCRIDIEVEEELTVLPVPRMILEPLVENAVQHGFVCKGSQLFIIRITALMKDNTLEICVMDNGCGIPMDRMAEINAKLSNLDATISNSGDKIGLYNVGTRLRLVYGATSGLFLEENEAGGLTVHMRIQYPLIDAEEDK